MVSPRIRAIAALGVAAAAFSFPAPAADSYSLIVTATVQGICKFTQASGQTLAFTNNASGGIDPSLAANATANASIAYKCTSGTAPSTFTGVGANDTGGNHVVKNGTNSMIYTVSLTGGGAGDGFGAGSTNKTVAVAGTILPAQFQSAPAGTYTDTLVVTIAP
ncbi:MAG TPA: spore coat protein U domain-containing protein [Usitatibacter sp.]|nr:spore coat protein U domain-containing protein [Usitatibacter sp.]